MGLSLLAYLILSITGTTMFSARQSGHSRPEWLRPLHYATGASMVGLVLLLLAIGIVGTLGHYRTLGHSVHLIAGLAAVVLVLLSAGSATQISPSRPWVRLVHIVTNVLLFAVFVWVLLTGWSVVQKYLP